LAWWTLALALAAVGAALALRDERTAALLDNTVRLVLAVQAIALPLGLLLALLVVRTDLPGRRLAAALLAGLLFVPLYVQTAAWQSGFGLTGWWTALSGGPVWLDGWRAAVWVHALAAVPWVALIVGAALRLVEPELEEDALLAARLPRVVRSVTCPAVLSALGIATLWIAVTTAGEMTVTDVFVVRTFAEEVYTQFAVERNRAALAALPAAGLTAVLVAAAVLLLAPLARGQRPFTVRSSLVLPLGRWRWPAALLVWLALGLMVAVPVASLAYKAGVDVEKTPSGQLTRSWSAARCLHVVTRSPVQYYEPLAWSFAVSSLAATAAVAASAPLAWAARRGGVAALPALAWTTFVLAVPGPLLGLGLIYLLDRPELPLLARIYDDSLLSPALAQAIRASPVALLALWHALGRLPPETLEAAATEGAGPIARLVKIALPQRRAAVAAAWLAALAVALGELPATILVCPAGPVPLSVTIFGLIHYSYEAEVAGICLTLLAAVAAVTLAAAWLLDRGPA
jgi:iron(III) transport system permease protein